MKYTTEEITRYRIDRSLESLEEAKILAKHKHWNTVVNRLYYSCFYVVQALLIKHAITATTHAGVKTEFHKKFVKSQTISREFGRLYSDLFNKRQEGDYQIMEKFSAE